jgi:hypothetical protein
VAGCIGFDPTSVGMSPWWWAYVIRVFHSGLMSKLHRANRAPTLQDLGQALIGWKEGRVLLWLDGPFELAAARHRLRTRCTPPLASVITPVPGAYFLNSTSGGGPAFSRTLITW